MTWREQLRDASFRGVPFEVDSAENVGGRRAISIEFPGRDLPQTEDLGRKARKHSFDAYVIGPEYMAARDALLAALEQGGPGMLVHPYIGELRVQIGEVRWVETSRQGGYCQFTIECFEATDIVYPRALSDTRGAAEAQTDAAQQAAAEAFAESHSVVGQPQRVIDAARDLVDQAVNAIEGIVSTISTLPEQAAVFADLADRLSSAAASLVLAPAELADDLLGLVRQVTVAAERPRAAFGVLQSLFGWGDDLNAVPTGTPSRQQQAANQAATTQYIQQLATLEAGRAAAQTEWDSADDALAARDALIEQLDVLTEADISDALYQALVAARAAVSRDISDRGAELPRIVRIQLPESQPALALAWTLYGDATRADELVARNAVRDPLFMPAGEPLEALDA